MVKLREPRPSMAPALLGLGLASMLLSGSVLAQAEVAPIATEQPSGGAAEVPFKVEDVLQRLDTLYRADSSEAQVRLTVVKPKSTRVLEMELWTLGDDKALVKILSPAREKGTSTLRVEDKVRQTLSPTIHFRFEGGPYQRPVVLDSQGRRRVRPFDQAAGLDADAYVVQLKARAREELRRLRRTR